MYWDEDLFWERLDDQLYMMWERIYPTTDDEPPLREWPRHRLSDVVNEQAVR